MRRWPSSLSSTCRVWITMIATNTSVQITASQSGRIFVAPCAPALIDIPPTDIGWLPPWPMPMPLMLPMRKRR